MANLMHLFHVGQKVKFKNEEFGTVNFIDCVVSQVYEDYIIITDTLTDTKLYCENGFNMECVHPDYNVV